MQAIGYDPRPVLKITPPSSASDNRPKSYRFIEAVKVLPTTFTQSETDFIFLKINPRLCGQLRSIFICLSDDEFRKKRGIKFPSANPEGANASDTESTVEADTEGNADTGIAATEAIPAQVPAPATSAQSSGRGPKRGASSPPESAAPPKK